MKRKLLGIAVISFVSFATISGFILLSSGSRATGYWITPHRQQMEEGILKTNLCSLNNTIQSINTTLTFPDGKTKFFATVKFVSECVQFDLFISNASLGNYSLVARFISDGIVQGIGRATISN